MSKIPEPPRTRRTKSTQRPAGDDVPNEVQQGRQSPWAYSQASQWVLMSGASQGAKLLYTIYCGYRNTERGDGQAWPSNKVLAKMLGVTPRSINNYVRELIALTAIDRYERFRDKKQVSNRIVVHDVPAEGYAGHRSIVEAHTAIRDELRGGTDGDKPHPPRKPVSTPPGNEFPPPPGNEFPPPPEMSFHQELDEGELDEGELDEAELPGADPSVGGYARAREDDPNSKPTTPQIAVDHDWPINESMQRWLDRQDHGLSAADVDYHHHAFIDYHYGDEHIEAEWRRLWRGWMKMAYRRAVQGLKLTDSLRAWAEKNTPDIDLDAETDAWLEQCEYKNRKFPNLVDAWGSAMLEAQECQGYFAEDGGYWPSAVAQETTQDY